MLREAPPSREAVTTSRTWPEFVDVKILTSSGMMAPASVPQVMIVESFHQSVPPPRFGISRYDRRYVIAMETSEVSHTSEVSGCSKLNLAASPYFPLLYTPLSP